MQLLRILLQRMMLRANAAPRRQRMQAVTWVGEVCKGKERVVVVKKAVLFLGWRKGLAYTDGCGSI